MRSEAAQQRDRRLAATLKRQHGVISRDQAVRCGASPRFVDRLLADGLWRPVHRGVYRSVGHEESEAQRAFAACLAAALSARRTPERAPHQGPVAVATGGTAARLLGLDGAPKYGPVELLSTRRPRLLGVTVHQTRSLLPKDVRRTRGLPITSAARTLALLARRVTPARLERLTDDALRRGLTRLIDLEEILDRVHGPGPASLGALRVVVRDRRPEDATTESRLEQDILRLLRDARLPTPVTQHPVDLGDRVVRIDLAYPDQRIAIEVDGFRYHSERSDHEKDRAKGNALVQRGWRLVRITSKTPAPEIRALLQGLLAEAYPYG